MIEQHVALVAWAAIAQQEGPPPMAGDQGGAPVEGAQGAAPATGQGGTTQPGPAFGSSFIWFLLIGMVFMIMIASLPQRKERKRREAMLGSLKKNDRVQTTGGMLGRIVEIKGDEVILKVDESTNTRIRFARSAIQTIVKEGPGGVPEEPVST